jgi:tetratricopeptide (TPR) repeat protein/transcriptional regulator with XRE-family HTH domain
MFGESVRAHRRRLALTQEELARETGISVRTVGKIEAGRITTPRPATVRLIADAFGLHGADRDRFCQAAAGLVTTGPTSMVPAQLPPDVWAFTGRTKQIERLDALLSADATAVVITAVSGTAGVGKTALAVHWAHRVADQFPDGQLYVNLRGFDPGGRLVTPAEAVRGFLDALGVPADRIPAGLDAQAALYRSMLARRQILVVLDNARDADHARPLLPGTPTAHAVVTSRNQLTPLVAAGAHPLTLDLLTHEEARQLLAGRLGPDRLATEPDAVEQIITACTRLPLALTIAAARAQHSGAPLPTLAAELTDTSRRLDALDAGDTTTQVRAVFSWSYTALTPPAARLFRLLGLHPGPDISAPAAASLAGHPVPEARPLLAELTRANLLTEHTTGRYTHHDLLRTYATELAHSEDSENDRHAATHRILDHYLHTAYTADRIMNPARDAIILPLLPPAPGVSPENPASHQQAMAWLTAEHPVLVATIRHAVETRFDTHTWQLAWTLNTFLGRQGHWHDLTATWQAALNAGGRLGDPATCLYAHRMVATAHTLLGRNSDAHAHLLSALDLCTQTGECADQAHVRHALAYLWGRQGRPDRALGYAQQASALYQAAGHRRGQAIALNLAGWNHGLLGDHNRALTHCEQAIALYQQICDRYGEATTWDSLGYAHHHLGHHTEAVRCYQRAIDLHRDLGDHYIGAGTLTHLGDAYHATGRPTAARTAWQQALDILTELHHPDADALHTKLRALDQTTPHVKDDQGIEESPTDVR